MCFSMVNHNWNILLIFRIKRSMPSSNSRQILEDGNNNLKPTHYTTQVPIVNYRIKVLSSCIMPCTNWYVFITGATKVHLSYFKTMFFCLKASRDLVYPESYAKTLGVDLQNCFLDHMNLSEEIWISFLGWSVEVQTLTSFRSGSIVL